MTTPSGAPSPRSSAQDEIAGHVHRWLKMPVMGYHTVECLCGLKRNYVALARDFEQQSERLESQAARIRELTAALEEVAADDDPRGGCSHADAAKHALLTATSATAPRVAGQREASV